MKINPAQINPTVSDIGGTVTRITGRAIPTDTLSCKAGE